MFEGERKFNQQRWEKQAAKHEARGRISKFMDKGVKTPEDFMHEEAQRDDDDFEKKFVKESQKEYKAWEEHCKPVRARFLERARDPENTNIVTVSIFMQGGMRAAGIAGRALAMDMMGMDSGHVDYVVGVSSGDVVGTRFVAGRDQLMRGMAALNGPLASPDFIDPLRPGNAINLQFNKKLEDEGEYAVDTDAIQKAHSKLWTVVSEPMKDGEEPQLRILDKKTITPGITAGTVATMSIPWVTGKPVEVDGVKYYDGGFGALPVKEIIAKVKEENPGKEINVLIYTQASFEALDDIKPSPWEVTSSKILQQIAGPLKSVGSLRSAGETIKQLAKGLTLKENLRKSLDAIEKETEAHIGVVFAPPTTLHMTSTDADEMEMAETQSFFDTFDLFGVPKPDEMPRYVSEKKRALKDAIESYKNAA